MPTVDKPRLLDTPETAEVLGVSPDTLAIWRCTKRYDLPYIKVGGSVMCIARSRDRNQKKQMATRQPGEKQ